MSSLWSDFNASIGRGQKSETIGGQTVQSEVRHTIDNKSELGERAINTVSHCAERHQAHEHHHIAEAQQCYAPHSRCGNVSQLSRGHVVCVCMEDEPDVEGQAVCLPHSRRPQGDMDLVFEVNGKLGTFRGTT